MTALSPFGPATTLAERRACLEELGVPLRVSLVTSRELEVIVLRCDHDLSMDETAEALGIASQTVKNHSTSILRKLRRVSFQGVCTDYGEEKHRMSPIAAMRWESV